MKARTMGAILLAIALFVPLALQAQMAGQQYLFHVDVPFPFMAGGSHLPAGHYHVYHPSDPNLVILQKDDNMARAVVYAHITETNSESASTKLVFNKYGDVYFLSQVWTENDREMHAALKCKAEQTLAAKYEKPGERVTLAKR
jgi:hypothetical protein